MPRGRNMNFLGMCLRRLFGETKPIETINYLSSRQLMTLTSYFTLKYLISAPNFITIMVVDMIALL